MSGEKIGLQTTIWSHSIYMAGETRWQDITDLRGVSPEDRDLLEGGAEKELLMKVREGRGRWVWMLALQGIQWRKDQ